MTCSVNYRLHPDVACKVNVSLLLIETERCKLCASFSVVCVCACLHVQDIHTIHISLSFQFQKSKMSISVWRLWCDGRCSGADLEQRSFYF